MKGIFTLIFFCSVGLVSGQTKTTQALDDKYEGLTLYFYRNTLRMLNQKEDPAFDELIKDIEKILVDEPNYPEVEKKLAELKK